MLATLDSRRRRFVTVTGGTELEHFGLSLDPWTGVIDVSVGAVLRSVGV